MPTWDEIMTPPEPLAPEGFDVVTVPLGDDTYNTCNPGVGDTDGDGLDGLAVPVIEDDCCRITLHKGDGTEVWHNDDVQFFNYFYDDIEAHRGTHWHPHNRHRHLFTQIFDIDGDGAPEVVCADGPVWVLDGRTGAVKATIDLGAHVQAWCPARLHGPDAPPSFIGGIEMRDGSGSAIVAVGTSLDIERLVPVDGRSFEDAVWAGDVDGDGTDEIVFSPATTKSMFLMDRDGRVRWSQRIEGVLGDDTHVDDLVIDSVLPGDKRQILMATGPALLDRDGTILWALGDRYHHAQRVLAVPAGGDVKDVYFCESYKRRSYLLDHTGAERWTFAGYQTPRAEFEGKFVPRLTTAGCLCDWFGTGEAVIVQAEVVIARPAGRELLDGAGTFYVFLFAPDGRVLATIPFDDALDGWGGAMCARAGRFTAPDREGLAVIAHSSSRLHFFSGA